MQSAKDILEYSQELRVLYVEDDIRLNEQTLDILEDYFDLVDSAVDGEDAIEKYNKFYNLNNNYYDIVITDINMPKLNGIEMIKKLKQVNPTQEFVVISAHSDSDKLLKLIDLGINYFLLKPIKYNKTLEKIYTVCQKITNKKAKEKYLITQAKNAAMGEMIDMIAHQWLGHLSIMKIKADYAKFQMEYETFDFDETKEYLIREIDSFDHLCQTLNEFRDFFKDDKQKEKVLLLDLVNSVKLLLKDTIIKNLIDIQVDIDNEFSVEVMPNEFKHVFINFIQNSIEAFNEKGIENKKIIIKAYSSDSKKIIEYIDTAGGIDEKNINKVFDPKFTTKKTGTGMGLYLLKLILEKIENKVEVENFKEGVKFRISN